MPAIKPSVEQLREALRILGMSESVECAYCGDAATEWDHLRPLVVGQVPTGYISEIHNLVPSCPKCNQSKTNKPWREWMFGPAKKSPLSRALPDLHERAARLERYEAWLPPTQVDFPAVVGTDLWEEYHAQRLAIISELKVASQMASQIRQRVMEVYGTDAAEESPATATESQEKTGSWMVDGPHGLTGPLAKNRAVWSWKECAPPENCRSPLRPSLVLLATVGCAQSRASWRGRNYGRGLPPLMPRTIHTENSGSPTSRSTTRAAAGCSRETSGDRRQRRYSLR